MVLKKIRIVTETMGITRIDCKRAWGFSQVIILFIYLDGELGYSVVCSCQNSPHYTLRFVHFTVCKLYQRKGTGGGGKGEEEENSK